MDKSVLIFTQWIVISPLDSTICQWINHHSLDTSIGFRSTYLSDLSADQHDPFDKSLVLIQWMVIYLLDIQPINNWGQIAVLGPKQNARDFSSISVLDWRPWEIR